MTQADPSLATRPAASMAMRFVSGPPALVRSVSSVLTPEAGGLVLVVAMRAAAAVGAGGTVQGMESMVEAAWC